MMDDGYFLLRLRGEGRFFSKGWGDMAACSAVRARFGAATAPLPIAIEWQGPWQIQGDVRVRDGKFQTPCFAEYLPAVTRTAHFRLMLPRRGAAPPIFLHMATTGEEGYGAREKNAGVPLAREGVGLLMLEHPFLGRRRPAEQSTTKVDFVAHLLLLGGVAVEEARSLLVWLRSEGYARLGIAGISKGGHLAALAGAQTPFSVAIVPMVAPHSGVPVFTQGLFSRLCDWAALDGSLPAGQSARLELEQLLSFTSVETVPPPNACPVIAIAARSDRFVPRASSEALQAHWPFADFRWLSGGHVSTIALRKALFRSAMIEAVHRL